MAFYVNPTVARLALLATALTLAACGGGSPALSQGVASEPSALARVQSVPETSRCLSSMCIYVPTSYVKANVNIYAGNANGNVSPTRQIAGAKTLLSQPEGIAVDANHKVYVANLTNAVTVYAAGANGNAKPIQTITGPNTGIITPQKLAVDASSNIYVANSGNGSFPTSVTVFASGANGNATPIQTISGSNTGMTSAVGIAVDGDNNIYVTNPGSNSVLVYAAGANGNVTPIQTISGSNTGLSSPEGIAVDGSKNVYVANYGIGSITVYASGANGNVIPIRTIAGLKTKLGNPWDIALNLSGNMYVISQISFFKVSSINVYAAGAHGNVAPIQIIKGSNTKLGKRYAHAIAVR